MKLSIRLQDHGVRNHKLWWIVVAPNRKNIFGRFIEHVGYWYPRHNTTMHRSIIFNLARVKYWISCGAVPSQKVQRFLSYYDIMPKPWYYVKSEAELQKAKENEKEPDDKKKRKLERKQKAKQRETLDYDLRLQTTRNRTKKEQIMYEALNNIKRENEFLRNILITREFEKYEKINRMAHRKQADTLNGLQVKLEKLQSELKLLEKHSKNLHPLKRAMLIEKINEIYPKMMEIRNEQPDRERILKGSDQILLMKTAEHEMYYKQVERSQQEIKKYYEMLEPMTEESYVEYLVSESNLERDQAEDLAREVFEIFEAQGDVMRKGDIEYDLEFGYHEDEFSPVDRKQMYAKQTNQQDEEEEDQSQDKQLSLAEIFKSTKALERQTKSGTMLLPSEHSINPFPDLKVYVPEDYYEVPKMHQGFIRNAPTYFPQEELEKYRQKMKKLKIFKN